MMPLLKHDGEIDYLEHFMAPGEADQHFHLLLNSLDWQEEWLRIAGKSVQVPRLVSWYGDAGKTYRYAGVQHEPQEWTPALASLRASLEAVCGRPFNSVLGNLYRTGQDAMGWHADDEPELGHEPYIASLSLGAERTFEIRHNNTRKTQRMPLAHGSLLLMHGSFQTHWKHRIPRQPGCNLPRINLTFRYLV